MVDSNHDRKQVMIERLHEHESSMYPDSHELVMPTQYVDLSEDEIEYTAGWSWKEFTGAVSVAAIVAISVQGGVGAAALTYVGHQLFNSMVT